jgi:hypothetical protein
VNRYDVKVLACLCLLATPAAAQRFRPAGVTTEIVFERSSLSATSLENPAPPSAKRRIFETVLGGLAGAALGAVMGYQAGDGSTICAGTCVRQPNHVGRGAVLGFAFGAYVGYVISGRE